MKIFCPWFGLHNYQDAHAHPDRGLGFHIIECTRCEDACVSEGGSGRYSILSTRDAVLRDAKKAAQLLPESVDEWTQEQRDVVRTLVVIEGLPQDRIGGVESAQRRLLAWEGRQLFKEMEGGAAGNRNQGRS